MSSIPADAHITKDYPSIHSTPEHLQSVWHLEHNSSCVRRWSLQHCNNNNKEVEEKIIKSCLTMRTLRLSSLVDTIIVWTLLSITNYMAGSTRYWDFMDQKKHQCVKLISDPDAVRTWLETNLDGKEDKKRVWSQMKVTLLIYPSHSVTYSQTIGHLVFKWPFLTSCRSWIGPLFSLYSLRLS